MGHAPAQDGVLGTEALFDRLNQAYGDAYEVNEAQIDCIQKAIKMLPRGASVLELGIGTGRPTASMLAEAGMHVTGIDLSSNMLDIARQNVPGATLHRTNMIAYQPPRGQKFDAVFAILAILQLPTSANRAMAFRMAHWLKPGGLLVLGAIDFTDVPKVDGYPADPEGEWLYHRFMDQVVKDNTFGVGDWVSLLRAAGVSLVSMDGSVFDVKAGVYNLEPQCFLIGQRGPNEALMGPWPLPWKYRGPRVVGQLGWQDFAERLWRKDRGALSEILKDNRNVLEVFSGSQPGEEKHSLTLADSTKHSKFDGSGYDEEAAAMPFSTKSFDAVVASWTLHLVKDLEHTLHEMARLVDPSAPNARLIIIQGAPYNELIQILNKVASTAGEPLDHQGFLFHTATKIFAEHGFSEIRLEPVDYDYVSFPERDLRERSESAAEVLTNMWYQEHPYAETIRRVMVPELERHFESERHLNGHPFEIGNQSVVLVTTVPRNSATKVK